MLDQPRINRIAPEAADIASPPQELLKLLAKGFVESGSIHKLSGRCPIPLSSITQF
jgi:hypothetical protein